MKHVPNLLSLSRIPLSIALFIFAMQGRWFLAATLFILALVTDALDGYVARRYNVESEFGGEVLESVCDLVLSMAAVAGLYFGGVIPLWVPAVLLIITALLQASHSTPFDKLKRHTFYLHPLFFLAVVYFSGLLYLVLCFDSPSSTGEAAFGMITSIGYQVAWVTAAYFKRGRLNTWFAGPPRTT